MRPFERKLPPVVAVGMVALSFAVTGGVLEAASFGEAPSVTVPGTFVNDVPGDALWVMAGGLVVFATVVPLMLAFTVARCQAVDDAGNPLD